VFSIHRRCFVSLLLTVLPVSLGGQDAGGAILHQTGGVLLNRDPAPLSSAIFPGALIEAPPNTAASITVTGSRITINPDTTVEFEGDEVELQHGSVFVETVDSFRVRAGCVLSTPALSEATQYSVTYRDNDVTVNAFKKDVNLDSKSSNSGSTKTVTKSDRVSVREGEQKSREDKCGAALIKSAVAGAKNGILNSPWAKWTGVGVIGVLTCVALCRDDDPVSPSGFNH